MDYCPPGSWVHGTLRAGILEWGAIPYSKGIFPAQGLNPSLLHCRRIHHRATWEARVTYILL